MKILFTTDGSPCSTHAMREAARLLPLADAEAYVVSVADVVPLVGPYEMAGTAATVMLERELESTQADLANAVSLLAELGVTARPIERQGVPADEILAVADEVRPDMIVLGSHGRNAVERFFLGSISDAVAHRFAGPVLIIRPED